ncbi:MAG: hypothetical protein FWE10_00965 [Rikenellaceae bacterium]|nr:hypothetical protein [Rikenellaceae bacterium]MCL2692307.1 hypothetical protein [Rikenellaceae bacterium]
MEITSIPDNYTGAFKDVTYRLAGVVPEQTVEVAVCGDTASDALGIKRFRGQTTYDINIANYLRRMMNPVPEHRVHNAVYVPAGRTAKAHLRIGGMATPLRTFTAGSKSAEPMCVLSDAPLEQSIAPGETDELTVIGAAGEPVFMYGFAVKGTEHHEHLFQLAGLGEMMAFQFNADHIASLARNSTLGSLDAYSHIEVCLERNSTLVPVRRYALAARSNRAVRVCWVNEYGALDYYTFAAALDESTFARRQRIYAADGYRICGSRAEKFIAVESAYESAETLAWLAGVVCSPRVWICEPGGGFTQVDVLTDNVAAGYGTPSSIRLTMREKKRKVYQNF